MPDRSASDSCGGRSLHVNDVLAHIRKGILRHPGLLTYLRTWKQGYGKSQRTIVYWEFTINIVGTRIESKEKRRKVRTVL